MATPNTFRATSSQTGRNGMENQTQLREPDALLALFMSFCLFVLFICSLYIVSCRFLFSFSVFICLLIVII